MPVEGPSAALALAVPLHTCTSTAERRGMLCQVGGFPHFGGRWAEWNGHFRDAVRQFIKACPGFSQPACSSLEQPCLATRSCEACPPQLQGLLLLLLLHQPRQGLLPIRPNPTSRYTCRRAYCWLQGTEGPWAAKFAAAMCGSPDIYASQAGAARGPIGLPPGCCADRPRCSTLAALTQPIAAAVCQQPGD